MIQIIIIILCIIKFKIRDKKFLNLEDNNDFDMASLYEISLEKFYNKSHKAQNFLV